MNVVSHFPMPAGAKIIVANHPKIYIRPDCIDSKRFGLLKVPFSCGTIMKFRI